MNIDTGSGSVEVGRIQLPADAGPVRLEGAAVRRPGDDVTICAWGGTLAKAIEAADELSADGIEADVIDLRSLRPIDDATITASVARTGRAVVVDEGWRSVGLSAEIAARITESCFHHLDAPVARVASAEVPIPYPAHLEHAALPQVPAIVAAAHQVVLR